MRRTVPTPASTLAGIRARLTLALDMDPGPSDRQEPLVAGILADVNRLVAQEAQP